ncbi:efflux RND transporter periplasmic adaptor subunit [Spirulina sp. CS-785/01]|uniref:efflux RND transporter periplasmic adaptor subunit n=1 Tax=Spirulina sp. CS-785/01 TaxID=3021716 RepID=UPI00232D478B|nr:efflux RND transporter periplasmic adaptor subunit [Spirulina sp. CS-785/01]MDB9314050.1 efflux RND transporter periplasmic adaptor subunit [Spirulina sp. CS-785/01]
MNSPKPESQGVTGFKFKLLQPFFRHKTLLLGIAIGLGLAVIGSRFFVSDAPETSPATVAETTSSDKGRTVTTAEVELTSVRRMLEATGSVVAQELIPVQSSTNSLQIVQVLAEEGDRVQAGQLLAQLDNSVLRAQYQQAQAAVARTEARLAELRAGARSEEIARAQQAVNSAKAGVRRAEADLALIEKRVERNQLLETEGAIARDRLDEILNQAQTAQATLEQEKARLQEARETLAELQRGTRPETLDQAEAQLAEAKSQVQLITAQLEDTRVTAPRSGVIAERNAKVGDVTAGSNTLFTIIEDGRLDLHLQVPETQRPAVQPGQPVRVTSDADPNLRLVGRVKRVDPVIEEQSRLATVRVQLPQDAGLQPGMFLRGQIVTSTSPGLTIPIDAALPDDNNEATVFVVQPDETVKATTVTLGEILADNRVEVLEGLEAGDRIVVQGAAYLKDGDLIVDSE